MSKNNIIEMEEILKIILNDSQKIKSLRNNLNDLMNNVFHLVYTGYDPINNYILKEITTNIINDTPITYNNKIYTSGSMIMYESIINFICKENEGSAKYLSENELFVKGYLAFDELIVHDKLIGYIVYVTDKGYTLINDSDEPSSSK